MTTGAGSANALIPDLAAVEDAMIATWPARHTAWDGGWVWRSHDGFTDRANAASCHDPSDDAALPERLAAMTAFYASDGLRPQLRETALMPALARDWAREMGWQPHSETRLLAGPMPDAAAPAPSAPIERQSLLEPGGRAAWLRAAGPCVPRLAANPADAESLLACLASPSLGLVLREAGEPVSAAQLALHGRLATLHNVGTAPHARGRGHARTLLADALYAARMAGADALWLAVEDDNAAALSLYAYLNLTECGRYRYWAPHDTSEATL